MSDTFDHALDAYESLWNDPDGGYSQDTQVDYSRNDSTIEVELEYKHQTFKAVLFVDSGKNIWIPKSQIDDWDDDCEYEIGELVEIGIPEWLAVKNGIY